MEPWLANWLIFGVLTGLLVRILLGHPINGLTWLCILALGPISLTLAVVFLLVLRLASLLRKVEF